MTCEWVKTNGALYLYNELPDDQRHELEVHLARCSECAAELASLRVFHEALNSSPVLEPSPSFLADSRMKLQEQLEHAQQSRGWSRFVVDVSGWMHQLKLSPALTALLLMIGFGGGVLATFTTQVAGPGRTPGSNAPQVESASIAAIRGISQDPKDSNKVAIRFDKLVPDEAEGSIDDPKIQQLLLYAARSRYNSGVRLDSIDVLTQKPQDDRIREALIFSLRYDKNPGVRLKALEALQPYVKTDMRVRDVMIEALLRDTNSGVRTEAIHSLRPVTADTSVRQALQVLAQKDPNQFIKAESRRMLANLPEIE
jgi:hypothetical protein